MAAAASGEHVCARDQAKSSQSHVRRRSRGPAWGRACSLVVSSVTPRACARLEKGVTVFAQRSRGPPGIVASCGAECEGLVFGACGIGCRTANSKSKAMRRQLDVGPTRRPEHAILRSAVRRSDGGQGFVFRWFDSIRFSLFSRGKVAWASSRPGLFSNPIASRRRSSFTQ